MPATLPVRACTGCPATYTEGLAACPACGLAAPGGHLAAPTGTLVTVVLVTDNEDGESRTYVYGGHLPDKRAIKQAMAVELQGFADEAGFTRREAREFLADFSTFTVIRTEVR